MSTVYFAKFNINEKIYEVYNNKVTLEELLKRVFLGMETEVELKEITKKKTTNYKFITLDKNADTFIVNGRLVAYAPGTHVSYDEETDNIVETQDNKKASYITFSFDVRKEIIGFVAKNDFGRKQFIDRFKNLIEKLVPEVGQVNLTLESDKQILEEKIKSFKHVDEIVVDLVPPNNDKKLFQSLFGINSEQLSDTGGNKFIFAIKGTTEKGINITSKFVKNLINGVIVGYGNVRFKGKNTSGDYLGVSSKEDALYVRSIHENSKDSIPEIAETTRAGINHLQVLQFTAKEDLKKQREELKEKLTNDLVGTNDIDEQRAEKS